MVKLFILWFKKLFSAHALDILKGNISRLFRRNQDLYEERYKYCGLCEKNVLYNSLGEICDLCGCSLKAKLRVPDEECGLGKWPQKDK